MNIPMHKSPLPLLASLQLKVVRINAFHSARNLHTEHKSEKNSSQLTLEMRVLRLIDEAAMRGDKWRVIEALTKEAIERHGTQYATHLTFFTWKLHLLELPKVKAEE